MTGHNPKILVIKTLADAKKQINDIGSDPASIEIMAPKMITQIIKLEKVLLQDACTDYNLTGIQYPDHQ